VKFGQWITDLSRMLLSARTDIWKRAARSSIIKSKILSKILSRRKNWSDSVLKRTKNNRLKCRGRNITHGR
jgi:RNA-binding protein YhbY